MNWQGNLLTTTEQIRDLIKQTEHIAVLGIKTEAQSDQPSVYVPLYMQRAGFEIVPVPVYYPDATEILGAKVYRSLSEIPGDVDMVDVFRRPEHVAAIVDDCIRLKVPALWLQDGVIDEVAAQKARDAGIFTVMNRCMFRDRSALG